MRHVAWSSLWLAVVCLNLTGCSDPRPDPDALADTADCRTLQDLAVDFVIDYVGYANTRPMDGVMSVVRRDGQPPAR